MYPCCSTYQYLFPLYGQITFRCMEVAHFIHLFISRWTFGSISTLWLLWTLLLWLLEYRCEPLLLVLLVIHLASGLLGHVVTVFNRVITKLFHKWLNYFTLSRAVWERQVSGALGGRGTQQEGPIVNCFPVLSWQPNPWRQVKKIKMTDVGLGVLCAGLHLKGGQCWQAWVFAARPVYQQAG